MNKQARPKGWPGRSIGLTFLLTLALFMVVGAIELAAGGIFLFCFYQGWLRFEMPLLAAVGGLTQFCLWSLIVGGVMAILRALILNPILRMVDDMKRLAAGDFSVRTPEGGKLRPRELKEFAAAFNAAAEELGGTELLRKDFVNNFSHEFKTPITSLGGFADLLLEDEEMDPAERREYLQIISEEAHRLADLANNVLALGRVETQTILTGVTEFDLAEQLRQVILLMEQKWRSKEIDIQFDGEELMCSGNEAQLKEVWVNLLDNAVKFSPPGGTVELTLKQEGNSLTAAIRDEGPGMDENVQAHIFDQFYQGDVSHRTQGNGLGLTIVRRIVTLHGGDVRVESTPENGSVFTVRLPRQRAG